MISPIQHTTVSPTTDMKPQSTVFATMAAVTTALHLRQLVYYRAVQNDSFTTSNFPELIIKLSNNWFNPLQPTSDYIRRRSTFDDMDISLHPCSTQARNYTLNFFQSMKLQRMEPLDVSLEHYHVN
uniref:Uncharacterized protein n=1 Tax=Panagrellus redivivus TaxID=6233 RepID=A0A7E4USR8_PANRE